MYFNPWFSCSCCTPSEAKVSCKILRWSVISWLMVLCLSESTRWCGGWRCPVATALARSERAYSSVTNHSLIMSSFKQVFFSMLIPNTIHVTSCWKQIKYLQFFSDLPNETVNGDDEEPAFYSTMVCCSLVNFAWTEAEHQQHWRCLLSAW